MTQESDWRPLPPNGGGASPPPQAKRKSGGSSKKAKAVKTAPQPHAQQHYAQQQHLHPHAPPRDHLPPPPLPVLELGVRADRIVSFEEKTRLGDDIQRLQEHQLPGLFQIIQSRGTKLAGAADDEVELDLNGMSAEALLEVRRYVDGCLLHK